MLFFIHEKQRLSLRGNAAFGAQPLGPRARAGRDVRFRDGGGAVMEVEFDRAGRSVDFSRLRR